jgi:hypothetical protein
MALVKVWNEQYPPGTPVKLVKDFGDIVLTKTRSEAWVISSGNAMVYVDGIAGGYKLSRVIPIKQ